MSADYPRSKAGTGAKALSAAWEPPVNRGSNRVGTPNPGDIGSEPGRQEAHTAVPPGGRDLGTQGANRFGAGRLAKIRAGTTDAAAGEE